MHSKHLVGRLLSIDVASGLQLAGANVGLFLRSQVSACLFVGAPQRLFLDRRPLSYEQIDLRKECREAGALLKYSHLFNHPYFF